MNRTIKFRGKSLYNDEWVYGYLLERSGKTEIYNGNPDGSLFWANVYPQTVGQFTGLHDAKGREIYEGDIVTWLTGRDGKGFMEIGRVEWRSDEGCYIVINRFLTRDNREIVQSLIRCTRDIKVRGNIHDNPELLINF